MDVAEAGKVCADQDVPFVVEYTSPYGIGPAFEIRSCPTAKQSVDAATHEIELIDPLPTAGTGGSVSAGDQAPPPLAVLSTCWTPPTTPATQHAVVDAHEIEDSVIMGAKLPAVSDHDAPPPLAITTAPPAFTPAAKQVTPEHETEFNEAVPAGASSAADQAPPPLDVAMTVGRLVPVSVALTQQSVAVVHDKDVGESTPGGKAPAPSDQLVPPSTRKCPLTPDSTA